MFKRLMFFGMLLLLTAQLFPVVNLNHSTGLFRIPTAENQGKGQFTFDMRYLISYFDFEDSFPTTLTYYDTSTVGGNIVVDTTIKDSIVHTGDAILSMAIPFGMSYAITDNDEIGVGWIFYIDAVLTQAVHIRPNSPGYIDDSIGHFPYFGSSSVRSSGIGDLTFFYKRTFNISDVFAMGALAELVVPLATEREETFPVKTEPDTATGSSEDITYEGGIYRSFRQGFGGGLTLIGTVKPTPESPLSFTGALGYNYYGYSEKQLLNVGIATQFKAKYFEPFVEVTADFNFGDDSISNPIRITPGLRFTSLPGLFLDIAYDFRLSSNEYENVESYGNNPDWQASIGFGWSHDFIPPLPELATIAGTVIDANTMEPIQGAIVTFSDTMLPPVMTDEFGFWEMPDISAPTDIILEALAEGYLSSDKKPLILYPGDFVSDIVFALNEEIIQGMIKGVVYEFTGEGAISIPIAATVTISGDTTVTILTNEIGEFDIILPPGHFILDASVEGYITQTKKYDLIQDQTLTTEFHLLKEKAEIVFHDINFEVAKSDLLPESYPIIDQVARILTDNPSVKIEVQGHTDSDGSSSYNQRLSEARANSVRDYLINYQGISPDRLLARGYGEGRLMISPERNRDDKRMNRRVEFHIIEN